MHFLVDNLVDEVDNSPVRLCIYSLRDLEIQGISMKRIESCRKVSAVG